MKDTLGFYNFALFMVWTAAAVGIIASVISGYINSDFSEITFLFSIIALLVSIPVYRKRKKLSEAS